MSHINTYISLIFLSKLKMNSVQFKKKKKANLKYNILGPFPEIMFLLGF